MLNSRVLNFVAVVTIIPFVSWSSTPWSQTQSRVTRDSCINPVGRIIRSGKSRQICKGEQINLVNDSMILCYINAKVLRLQAGIYKTDSICMATQVVQKCTPISPEYCPHRKGPNENENAPNIIQTYGKILLNNRPLISWSAVPGATSYTVQGKSSDVSWETEVKDTTLPYPLERKELQYGNAFKIIVIANKGNSPISTDTLVVHLLPEIKIKQIRQIVQQIISLGLPSDEVFVDLDAIYMSEGLLNQTIESLKERIKGGSQNPTLYRILGDRYVEAWLPEEAKGVYTKAVGLARVQRNSVELAIAQERLRLLGSVGGTITSKPKSFSPKSDC